MGRNFNEESDIDRRKNKAIQNTPKCVFCMAISISLVCHNSDCWDIFLLEIFRIYRNDCVIAKNTIRTMLCVTAVEAPGEEEVCDRASGIVSRALRFVVRAPQFHPRALPNM